MLNKNKNYTALLAARSTGHTHFVISPRKYQKVLDGNEGDTKTRKLVGALQNLALVTQIREILDENALPTKESTIWEHVDTVRTLQARGIPFQEFLNYAHGMYTKIINADNTVFDTSSWVIDFIAFPTARYDFLKEQNLID